MARISINLGSESGLRPQDLAGAITNQAGVPSRALGEIKISYRRSTVEVVEELAEEVIAALRRITIKGKSPAIRRA